MNRIRVATLFSVIVAAVFPTSGAHAAATQNAILTVRILRCPAAAGLRVAYAMDGKTFVPQMHDDGGILTATVTVHPGKHNLRIVAGPCSTDEPLVLLSGRHRAVTVVLWEGRSFGGGSATLAGSVPLDEALGSIALPDDPRHPLESFSVQRGAYYIDRVPPGRYTLRFVLLGTGLQVWLPVEIRAGQNIRNVTSDEVLHHIGSLEADEKGALHLLLLWPYKGESKVIY